MEIAHEKLHETERCARHDARRPDGDHAAPAYLCGHEPEGDDERKERQLAAHHRAELEQVEAGERRERDEGCAERAEGDGRGVADERELSRLERFEAEPDQQGARDCHRCAEAGGALDEGAERKRDQERLNASVARDTCNLFLKDGELAGFNGELVDEDRVEDEPPNREQTEGGTVAGGGQGEFDGHAVDKNRDAASDGEGDQRGEVCAHVPEGEQGEEDDDGNRGDEGGDADPAERGVDLGPSHGVEAIGEDAEREREGD